MIASDSRFKRSSSCRAFSASSSDLRIVSSRAASALSNGPQANFARSVNSTRNVAMVQMKSPGSTWTSGLFIEDPLRFQASLPQDDQQSEDFRENRDAFEQEER